jgi:hypothetical protein
MYYADKRQRFLVDQGYYFEVIQALPFMTNKEERDKLLMSQKKDQVEMLSQILQNDETKLEKEEEREGGAELEEDEDQRDLERHIRVQMGGLTGGYGDIEYD